MLCLAVVEQREPFGVLGDLRQALTLFRETGNRVGEAEALNRMGETLRATGQSEQASTRPPTSSMTGNGRWNGPSTARGR